MLSFPLCENHRGFFYSANIYGDFYALIILTENIFEMRWRKWLAVLPINARIIMLGGAI